MHSLPLPPHFVVPEFMLKTGLRQTVQFNSTGVGELQVGRLIDGKEKSWSQRVSDASAHDFKTLIVSDWSLSLYIHNECVEYTDLEEAPQITHQSQAQILFKTLAETLRCKLYFLQEDDLIPYAPDLKFADVFDGIVPCSQAVIARIAEKKLPPALQEIAILDYTHLRLLMNSNDPYTVSRVHVDPRHISSLSHRFPVKSLVDSFTPGIDCIEFSFHFGDDGRRVYDNELMQKIEDYARAQGVETIFRFVLTQDTLKHLRHVDWASFNIDSLCLNEICVSALLPLLDEQIHNGLQKVKTCILDQASTDSPVDLLNINTLLQHMPHLEHLIFLESMGTPLQCPAELKKLSLHNITLPNEKSLIHLLNQCPQLQVLECDNVSLTEHVEAILPLCPRPSVKALCMKNSSILTPPLLDQLIRGMSELKMLVLDYCENLSGILPPPPGGLEDLKQLVLYKMGGLTPDQLYLWTHAPHALESLKIEITEEEGPEVHAVLRNPAALRQLYLHPPDKNDRWPAPSWVYQLSQLNRLSLDWVDFEIEKFTPAHLSNLLILHCQCLKTSERDLARLLAQTSILSHLILIGMDEIERIHGAALPPFSLPGLTHLKVEYDEEEDQHSLAPSIINAIIATSPALRLLSLPETAIFSQHPQFRLQPLQSLQGLYYLYSRARLESLRAILPIDPTKLLHILHAPGAAWATALRASLRPDIAEQIAWTLDEDEPEHEAAPAHEAANPVYAPHRVENLFHWTGPGTRFDPDHPPPKSYAQDYIIHCFCQYLKWLPPDGEQENIDLNIAAYQKGLCATFASLFFSDHPHTLVYYFELILAQDWTTDEGKRAILAHSEINQFFQQLLLAIDHEPPHADLVFSGVFQLTDLWRLLGQHFSRFHEGLNPETHLYFRNAWHACSLTLRGLSILFYDPNHPQYYHEPTKPDLLLEPIYQALGPALMIQYHQASDPPLPVIASDCRPEDLPRFIQNGGLFLWVIQNNLHWADRFQNVALSVSLQQDVIKALFLRDTNYRACLYCLLSHPEKAAVIRSLAQWLGELTEEDRRAFRSDFKKSLTVLSPDFLNEWIANLKSLQPSLSDPSFSLCGLMIEASEKEWMARQAPPPRLSELKAELDPLVIAYLNETPFSSQKECEARLLKASAEHILLKLPSAEAIRSFLLHFQSLASRSELPCFVIHQCDDLRCARDALKFNKAGQQLTYFSAHPHQGPLYDFIEAHQSQRFILLVDWSGFTPQEILQANTLIDEIGVRAVDGLPLPHSTAVIGCLNQSDPAAYQGQDFLRRHHQRWVYPYPLPEVRYETKESWKVADSFLSAAFFPPPLLINLYESLHWKTMLLGAVRFTATGFQFEPGPLCQDALDETTRSYFIKNPPWHDPEFRNFWDELQLHQRFTVYGRCFRLPSNIKFSYEYGYTEEDEVSLVDSMPEDAAFLYLNPTTLSQFYHNWQITPTQKLIPLPGFLESHPKDQPLYCRLTRDLPPEEMALFLSKARACGITLHLMDERNRDFRLLSQTTVSHAETLVISADECAAGDLMFRIQSHRDATIGGFKFTLEACAVLQALRAGKTVILKGSLKPELMDLLIPVIQHQALWINGQFEQFSGRLVLADHTPAPTATFPDLAADFPDPSSFTSADAFETAVCTMMLHHLESDPLISITGPTGGGKTSFFQKSAILRERAHVHYGEGQMRAWAKSRPEDGLPALLVIDEANVRSTEWTCCEDLFNSTPSICLNGQYYPLTPAHRVIFIGNPQSYGGERMVLPIMKRHPATLTFPTLPPAYVREKILAPLLNDHPNATAITERVLAAYQQAASFTTEAREVAATPRDLQMMALAVCATGSIDAIHPILHSLLPPAARRDFEPPAHLPTALLDLLLAVRRLRTDPSHQAMGLSALSIMGEPGCGKSFFVKNRLREKGIPFCEIPASWPDQKKRERLLQAFHAGEVVLFEEINSASFMSDLLNAVLSGHDLAGKPPARPGFILIATANPVSQGGHRQAFPPDLERRFLHAHFPAPSDEAMLAILKERNKNNLPEDRLRKLMVDYHALRSAGKAISLGDLVNIVDPPDASLSASTRKRPRDEGDASAGATPDLPYRMAQAFRLADSTGPSSAGRSAYRF